MRAIGLDVHLEFCEVAIAEGGEVRSAGRIADETGRAGAVRPKPRQDRPRRPGGDRQRLGDQAAARAPRRRGDRGLAGRHRDPLGAGEDRPPRLRARWRGCCAAGELDPVWVPDRRTQVMRRRLQRRSQLVAARTRAKNEIHAALMRQLVGRAPFTDLFGKKGRRWLAELELAEVERELVDAALRQVEFLDSRDRRGRAADRRRSPRMARGPAADDGARGKRDLRRDVHGGDRRRRSLRVDAKARRLPRARPEGAPVGLGPGDPRADLKAGLGPPPAMRWSRRAGRRSASPVRSAPSIGGSRRAAATRSPSSPRARKLACLFWRLLTREEDYASGQPSLTRRKLRLAEIRAGAPSRKGIRTGKWVAGAAMREAERPTAEQAEAAYRRTVSDWQATQAERKGRRRDTGARI